MESIETADLIELVLIMREPLGSQLQFWLTASFAVIVASFVAGSRLTVRFRVSIGLLYLLATAMTFAGWAAIGEELFVLYKELESRGVELEPPWMVAGLRLFLLILGTVLTLVFLYQDRHHDGSGNA